VKKCHGLNILIIKKYMWWDNISSIDLKILPNLIKEAKKSDRKRIMYCLHNSVDSMLHTMVNVIYKDSYICPHKHLVDDGCQVIKKWESYLILDWKGKLLFFDDNWIIEKVIDIDANKWSMVLVPEGVWHSIISISEYIVIFENKTWPWEEWKDKVFHDKFPLEGEDWVNKVLGEWYSI